MKCPLSLGRITTESITLFSKSGVMFIVPWISTERITLSPKSGGMSSVPWVVLKALPCLLNLVECLHYP